MDCIQGIVSKALSIIIPKFDFEKNKAIMTSRGFLQKFVFFNIQFLNSYYNEISVPKIFQINL